jgi:hypothetical protein
MKIRNLLVAGLAMALVSSSFATYTARIYFQNATSGSSNVGAVTAHPGDAIQVRFTFTSDGARPTSWSILQVALDLTGNTVMGLAEANTWDAQLDASVVPHAQFQSRLNWQPGDGDMYDYSTDPSGGSGGAFMTSNGLYALIGIAGTQLKAKNWDVTLFTFHAAGAPNEELHFLNEGRQNKTGVNTLIIDQDSKLAKVSDNFVKMVPEPGTVAAMAAGLVGLLGLRRRK